MQNEIWTIGRLIDWTTRYFSSQQLESPRLDAEHLLAHVLKLRRLDLYLRFDQPLQNSELQQFKAFMKRRAQHEPLAYLIGEADFHHISLKIDRRALIPRPESELLVEHSLNHLPPNGRFLELGIGSGAIALALLHARADVTAVGVDLSAEALALSHDNARRLNLLSRLRLLHGDLFAPLDQRERFHLIVSNPPYVANQDAKLEKEVARYEPALALYGGKTGTEMTERLIQEAGPFLFPYGWLCIEMGHGQAEKLTLCAKQAGLTQVSVLPDLEQIPRILKAQKMG